MKKILLSGTFLCATLLAFGQEKAHSCSAAKSKTFQTKSASLSVNQIAQTERYDVHYYTLDLEMTNTSTALSGTGGIYGKARENLDSVWFELFQTFTISEIRLNDATIPYHRQNSAIKVPVNLSTGQSFKIEVDYAGTPPTAATNPLGGAGMTNDDSPSWGNQVTWSLSEPFSAYEWWPCKQSLKDKADSVSVKITVPSACKAGSNGILEQVVDLGNGKTRYEWKHKHPIDYYLVSVAVAEYVEYNVYANPTGSSAPILIQNFIYNNPQTLPNFQDEIDETVDFMEYFSEIFGLYPFADEKYGHCMAPLSGGMEHQTMTTQGFFERTLTAHELAHQWWGNHVTCASWSDIWVNEGFASYAEYLMLEELYPGDQVSDMQTRHQTIMQQPTGSVWVEDSLNDSRIFSSRLTYDKGAALVHTLRFLVNDDNLFFQTLRDFQQTFADSVAVGTDIQVALENASGLDLSTAFEQWYFGEGYPTYSAQWNMIGNEFHVKISHSVSAPNITPTFTTPLELRLTRSGLSDTIVRLEIQGNTSSHILPMNGTVSQLNAIDPNNWIINRVGSIVKNDNLNLLSIQEKNLNESSKIYPNPSNQLVYIETNKGEKLQVTLLDPKGKIVMNETITSPSSIDLSNFPAGMYLIQIKNETNDQITRKLIRN